MREEISEYFENLGKSVGSIFGPAKEERRRVPPLSSIQKEELIAKVGTRCCYPNCTERVSLEVHHITPREEGGSNKETNLVVLCATHHRLADREAIPKSRLKRYCVARMKRF